MKPTPTILFAALLGALAFTVPTLRAEEPATLTKGTNKSAKRASKAAPNSAAKAEGKGTTSLAAPREPAAGGGDAAAELAKKLQNPIASLVSVPLQSNWDFGAGRTGDGLQYRLNFQPVIPMSLNAEWNVISRTIIPFISQEDVFKVPLPKFPGLPGHVPEAVERRAEKAFNRAVKKSFQIDEHQDGLGDITQSFFFSPKEPTSGGWVWGAGPVFQFPMATDDLLGEEQWGAGPTLVVLKQSHGWTYGALMNHIWSFAGDNGRSDVNRTFLQPFLSYTTKTHTTFQLNAESSYDWERGQWTAPVNLGIQQLVKIGQQPVALQLGGRYYAEGPDTAPEWGLRFTVTLLFPN